MQKVDITTRYNEEQEVRTDTKPYLDYAKCIINTFPMEQIKSFCDIGCATGHLLYSLKQYNSSLDIRGYEYFEYHKTSFKFQCTTPVTDNSSFILMSTR